MPLNVSIGRGSVTGFHTHAAAIMKPAVVVTGASTGIGLATAETLVANGFRVYGSVRDPLVGQQIADRLGPDFTALEFDVTDDDAVSAAARRVANDLGKERLAGLVNNAGIAVPGPAGYIPARDFERQMAVNVVGAWRVTQAFLPMIGIDRWRVGLPGRIVMVSSVAGRMGTPFLAPYVASKHALEGMAESLRRELDYYGVDVVIVAPGQVATPIWDKAEALPFKPYENLEISGILHRFREEFLRSGQRGLPPEVVARVIHSALSVPRPRLRYAVLRRPFRDYYLPMLLPRSLLDRLIRHRLGY